MDSSSNPKKFRHERSLSADAATGLQSFQSPTVTDDLGIPRLSAGGWTVRTNEYAVVEERQQQRCRLFMVESGNLKGRRLFEGSRDGNLDSGSDEVGGVSDTDSIEDARRGLEMDGEVEHDLGLDLFHGAIVEQRCSGSEGSSEEGSSWKCGQCNCCCCCSCSGPCGDDSLSKKCENEKWAVAVKEMKEKEIVKVKKARGSVSRWGRRRLWWVVSGTCVGIALMGAVLSIIRSVHGVGYGKVGVGLVPT